MNDEIVRTKILQAIEKEGKKFANKKISQAMYQEEYTKAGLKMFEKLNKKLQQFPTIKEIEEYLTKKFKAEAKKLNECGPTPASSAEWQAIYNAQVAFYHVLDEE